VIVTAINEVSHAAPVTYTSCTVVAMRSHNILWSTILNDLSTSPLPDALIWAPSELQQSLHAAKKARRARWEATAKARSVRIVAARAAEISEKSKPGERRISKDQFTRAHEIIDQALRLKRSDPTIAVIKREVGLAMNISDVQLDSRRRYGPFVTARHVAIWIASKATRYSLTTIGAAFCDGLDHTTIIHAIRRIDRDIAHDPAFATKVEAIRAAIESSLDQR
jgi:chromosomal replication initiation ATPase DnaA